MSENFSTTQESKQAEPRRWDKIRARVKAVLGRKEKSEPEKATHQQYSRRDFLKKLGIATGAGLVEAYLGPVSEFLAVFEKIGRDNNLLEKGNAAQFILILRRLISECLRATHDQELLNQKLELLGAWIKMNAAIHYASRSNKEIAASLAFHFLYGDGEDLDIKDLFLYQIESLFDELFMPEDLVALGITPTTSPEDKVKILFQQMLAQQPLSATTRHLVWTTESSNGDSYETVNTGVYIRLRDSGSPTYFAGEAGPDLVGNDVTIFGVPNLSTESTFYGLAQFTASITGRVSAVNQQGLEISQATLGIRDEYDWLNGTNFDAEIRVADAVDELGLSDLFTNPIFNDLLQTRVGIYDREAALLAQEGFAHNFDVVAAFTQSEPIFIENTQAVAPTNDYIESAGARVTQLGSN